MAAGYEFAAEHLGTPAFFAVDVTDPGSWASYPQVRGRKNKGYALGNNVGCGRVHNCINPETGAVHAGVAEIVAPILTSAYIEVSLTGTGFLMLFDGMSRAVRVRRVYGRD